MFKLTCIKYTDILIVLIFLLVKCLFRSVLIKRYINGVTSVNDIIVVADTQFPHPHSTYLRFQQTSRSICVAHYP